MDKPRKLLHYLNMCAIPTYALYGETDGESRQDWLHWETIQARSRLHEYRIAPHRHEQFIQCLLLTAGRAEMVLDGETYRLLPDSVAVVPAGSVHGYEFSPDVEGVVVTLMESDLAGLGLERPEPMVIVGNCSDIALSLRALIDEADHPGLAHDMAMRAHLTLLLVRLQRADRGALLEAPANGRAGHVLARFRDLVEQRYRQCRRVSDYAARVGISHTHLNRLCRQELGRSALEVIEGRIAIEARRHLLFSTLSIQQIGAELGYDDPAYFSRFITRRFGMPPAALRQQMRRRSGA